MKNNILIGSLAGLFIALNVNSQNFEGYKTGQKLNYTRIDAPSIMDIPNVGLLTPKELKPVQQKFDADVKAGLIKGKEKNFNGIIGEVISGQISGMLEITFPTATYTVSSFVVSTNDTVYGIKNMTATPMMDNEGNIEGFIKQGIVKYPKKMKLGEALPVTVDYTAMLPKKMDFSYKKTVLAYVTQSKVVTPMEHQGFKEAHIESDTKKYFKEITVNSKATFQIAPSTTTYRFVESEDDVVFNGKTYKAFKIITLMDTKVGDVLKDIDTDAFEHKLLFDFMNGYVKKKTDKALKMDGYEWYVPELGLVLVAEIFDAQGKSMYKSILNSIN